MAPSPFGALPYLLLLSSIFFSTHAERWTYIVRVQNDLKPSIFPTVQHWYASTIQTLSSPDTQASFLHIYQTVFHGFSARLTASEADLLRAHPAVRAVIPDRVRHLHTTHSPQFLGLVSSNNRPNSLLSTSDAGSSVVVAVLDTGIRPNHRSFHDRGLGPVPSRWNGSCEAGPIFPSSSCNRKLIGARFFSSGALASMVDKKNNTDVLSPYDTEGHGTHTASTAVGRRSAHASMHGYAAGVAAGVAPKARLGVYKVCWSSGCFDSDILAAFDRAVLDGADIISLSVGAGAAPYHVDPVAIGALGAVERGVIVVASAGNDGPGEFTVTNVAPWITTVGAGTMDRRFPVQVRLGDGTVIDGTGIWTGVQMNQTYQLIYAGNASSSRLGMRTSSAMCVRGSLDPAEINGKIVLCERGGVPRVEKGLVIKEAGGAGMIVANQSPDGDGVVPDAHVVPTAAVGYLAGTKIREYIQTSKDPISQLVFGGTKLNTSPAPTLAAFSARGPNPQSQYVIKPDVIAPGVGILAAWPDDVGPSGLASDERRAEFNVMTGTSMACPHVSGLAALLKAEHPDWSPARIRSAMMTTAYFKDNEGNEIVDESSGGKSSPWGVGSGHVDPEKAVDPGLVYDIGMADYLNFLCSSNYTRRDIWMIARRKAIRCSTEVGKPWELNYPSIAVVLEQRGNGTMEVVVHRTVTDVGGDSASEYVVSVSAPEGASVTVVPGRLVFASKGQKQGYMVRVSAENLSLTPGSTKTAFGSLTWDDGKHHLVRSPIAVTWQQPY